MNIAAIDHFTTDDADNIYGLDGWGNGYLAVADDGHLLVTPGRDASKSIDVLRVVEDLARRGVRTPLLLRFPQLLEGQVHELSNAFANAIREYQYPERYFPVFPIKVNQQRSVVEGLLESGWKWGLGLEVGSRPELLAATALPTPPDSLLICNGFKDHDYLASASAAVRLGKKVVVVIEKPFEVDQIARIAAREEFLPMIGFRIRLQSKGSGMWEKSGGYASKFGLTTLQLLRAVDQLNAAGLGRRLHKVRQFLLVVVPLLQDHLSPNPRFVLLNSAFPSLRCFNVASKPWLKYTVALPGMSMSKSVSGVK